MRSKQTTGNTLALTVVLIVLLAVASLMLANRATQPAEPVTQVEVLQNRDDLEKVSKELDEINVDSVDTGLNEISRDAAAI